MFWIRWAGEGGRGSEMARRNLHSYVATVEKWEEERKEWNGARLLELVVRPPRRQ